MRDDYELEKWSGCIKCGNPWFWVYKTHAFCSMCGDKVITAPIPNVITEYDIHGCTVRVEDIECNDHSEMEATHAVLHKLKDAKTLLMERLVNIANGKELDKALAYFKFPRIVESDVEYRTRFMKHLAEEK